MNYPYPSFASEHPLIVRNARREGHVFDPSSKALACEITEIISIRSTTEFVLKRTIVVLISIIFLISESGLGPTIVGYGIEGGFGMLAMDEIIDC